MTEVVIDERPKCPRCGEPMNAGVAFVCGRGFSQAFDLPPVCESLACQQRRNEDAIARAIAAGVIDP